MKVELDDCDHTRHCISTVPESVEAKRLLAFAAESPDRARRVHPEYGQERMTHQEFEYWRNDQRLPGAVDISCRAGSAIVFNNHNFHAGTVRQTPHHRRSFGFDYGHAALCANHEDFRADQVEPRLARRYSELLGYMLPPPPPPAAAKM